MSSLAAGVDVPTPTLPSIIAPFVGAATPAYVDPKAKDPAFTLPYVVPFVCSTFIPVPERYDNTGPPFVI